MKLRQLIIFNISNSFIAAIQSKTGITLKSSGFSKSVFRYLHVEMALQFIQK